MLNLSSPGYIANLKIKAQRIANEDRMPVATVLEYGKAWNWRYDWLRLPKLRYPKSLAHLTVLNVAEPMES